MHDPRPATLVLLCLLTPCVTAQQKDDEVLAGHSYHGEAFNEGPRQSAYLMAGCGAVRFEVSSHKPETQKFFNQGVGQLHGFWYLEAERSFRQVVTLEPDCAMGYWGLAMANVDNPARAASFIEEAVLRLRHASEREQRWIDSLSEFYEVTPRSAAKAKASRKKKSKATSTKAKQDRTFRRSKRERSADLADAYLRLMEDYPADVEAAAFYVNRRWINNGAGIRTQDHEWLDGILRDLFDLAPMHPAHHYAIHLWDRKNAKRALASAAVCGQTAPAIAHQWHMSGHIFAKLHRHEEAAWQQMASARVDHFHMMHDRVMPHRINNFGHNNEWLARSLNHVGRAREALALAKNMLELPRHPEKNRASRRSSIAGYGVRRFIESCHNYGMLDELIDLSDHGFLTGGDDDRTRLQVAADLGGAFLAMGDVRRGKAQLVIVRKLAAKTPARRAPAGDGQGRRGQGRRGQGRRGRSRGGSPQDRIRELEGLLALAEGRKDEAAEKLKRMTMGRLFQADAHLALDNAKAARRILDAEAKRNPNRAEILARQVRALWADGDHTSARKVFDNLRIVAGHGDLDTRLFESLASIAQTLGYPRDWRRPRPVPADAGKRPPLDELGPFRWQPQPAIDWELPDAGGGRVRLSREYRDRPVLVIFYLGFGCLHCVEQLQAFHPMAEDYRKAGIDIVAIGTDSLESMRKSLAALSPKDRFAFRLVSDEKMKVFKQWRAYDDFENLPLHGTFLVDRKGRVRWQDISFEPFDQPKWLLQECQRLLAQGRRVR